MKKLLFLILCSLFFLPLQAQYTQTGVMDLNFTETQIFKTGWQPANRPGYNYGSGFTFKFYDSRYSAQMFMPCAGKESELYIRGEYSNQWGNWNRVWHSGNIDDLKVADLNLSNYWQVNNGDLNFLGNVGIGASYTGNARLTIKSEGATQLRMENDTPGEEAGMRFRVRTADDKNWLHADIKLISTSNSAETGFLGFKVPANNTVGAGFKMIINQDGNVGIGTETPNGYKLAVNGTIRAKEIKVETNWADFVFKDDYQLMKLSDLEDFIEGNGHLPEIPTEKEVEENGISLGEMNSKLLQKIEELTLYIIDQNQSLELERVRNTHLQETQLQILQVLKSQSNEIEQLKEQLNQ